VIVDELGFAPLDDTGFQPLAVRGVGPLLAGTLERSCPATTI
jgi:hypothetical protein